MQWSIGLTLDILCLAMNLYQDSQYLIVEYVLLYKKYLSFAGACSQMNTTLNQNRPGRNVKLNKFLFGTQTLQDLLCKHRFTSSV